MGCGCAERRAKFKKFLSNLKRGSMAKAGFMSHPPKVSVERGTLNQQRQVEFWVSDIRAAISRLNVQLKKCHQGKVAVALKLDRGDGGEVVVHETSTIPTADTASFKRPIEYWVHDARSTIGRLNGLLQKCKQVNVDVTLKLDRGPGGENVVVLESAVLP